MREQNKSNNHIRTMAECAILIAMSVVLSFVKIWHMPLGGSVTLVSMLPVCVISVRHGMRRGIGSAFVYAVFQLGIGLIADGIIGWGLTVPMLVGCMTFDYIAAYTVLGFAGVLRRKGECGVYVGISAACVLRFASHFLSGYVIFRNLEQWELFGGSFSSRPALYSVCYNGLYMLPELVITLAVAVILMRIPVVREKIMAPQDK